MSADMQADAEGKLPCGCALWQSMSTRIGLSACPLHAAAPELLEALRALTLIDFAEPWDVKRKLVIEAIASDARAAIRKATEP